MSSEPTSADFDLFAALDSELLVVSSKSKLEAKKASLLASKRGSNLSREAAQAFSKTIASINAEIDAIQWKSQASVALFQVQTCDYCASVHTVFLQFMTRQVTTQRPKVQRWLRARGIEPGLPHETISQITKTHCCADCAGDFGFDLTKAETKFERNSEPFSIAVGYESEEVA